MKPGMPARSKLNLPKNKNAPSDRDEERYPDGLPDEAEPRQKDVRRAEERDEQSIPERRRQAEDAFAFYPVLVLEALKQTNDGNGRENSDKNR